MQTGNRRTIQHDHRQYPGRHHSRRFAPGLGDRPSRLSEFGHRVWGWVSSESLLLAVLIGSFLTRLFIADRQSYWLDELYAQ